MAQQQSFMLENNHLYRRIQHNHLFKAFSRTYSRQTPARKLHNDNKNSSKEQPTYSNSTPLLLRNFTQYLNQNKLNAQQNSAISLQLSTQTAPAFKRSQGSNQIEVPFYNTLNMTNFECDNSKLGKGSCRGQLSRLIQKRKASSSSAISNLQQNVRKQNFKLKSCSQAKQINYEGEVDETDFSILEYNKRYQNTKQKQQKYQRQMEAQSKIWLLKYRFKQTTTNQLKGAVGKRIAAHLFNRYTRKIEGFNGMKKRDSTIKMKQN